MDPHDPSWGHGEHPARIAYAAHLVSTEPYDQFRDYVPIHSETMKRILSAEGWCGARQVLRPEWEVNHSYLVDTYSKGYRWNERWRKRECVEHILECPRFAKKIAAHHQQMIMSMSPVAVGVHEVMKLVTCTIDDPDEFIRNLPAKPGSHETHRRAVYRASIQKIADQAYVISNPGKSGRMYHTLAQTPRSVRANLTIDGEKAVEVDLHNSQPYFMATIFPELGSLAASVSAGRFYEDINANLESPMNIQKKDERSNFKAACLIVMYSKPKDRLRWCHVVASLPAQIERSMDQCFPGLPDRIRQYAATHGPTALAIAMQQRESGVFIRSALPKLQAMGIPTIPIHDGYLCRASDRESVKRLLEEELFDATRLKPCISG
jgi:hypothetical protein